MRRVLGLMLAVVLMGGLVAACGSSSGSKNTTPTTVASSGGGGATTAASSGGGSGNSAVQAYCKEVNTFVATALKDKNDPASLGNLSTQGQKLATDASKLATSGLTAADGSALSACSQKATSALSGL